MIIQLIIISLDVIVLSVRILEQVNLGVRMPECERRYKNCINVTDVKIDDKYVCRKCIERGELKEWRESK